VADRIESVGGSAQMIIAGLLHDTLEDTQTTYEEICQHFGYRVADLVLQVTDISRPSDGNRAVRKARDREHLRLACPDAKTIKLADLIDNAFSIIEHDPKFAKVYMHEFELLLPLLQLGNEQLFDQAKTIIEGWKVNAEFTFVGADCLNQHNHGKA
jgi:(p)ppGpp synthase/HD superfamily hydrolase